MKNFFVLGALLLGACSSKSESKPAPKAVETSPDAAGAKPDAKVSVVPNITPGAEHTVYQFGPNREMAHRIVDGDLVMDAGAPGFARYVRFNLPKRRWFLMEDQGGEPTADPRGGGTLDVPLTADQAKAARSLVVRVHAAKAGGLAIKLEGAKVQKTRVELEPGWQTVAVPLEGNWMEGENFVVVEAGTRVHIRWMRVSHEEATAAAALPDPLAASGWNQQEKALAISEHSGLAWYVTVPERAVLVADVDSDCKAEVAVRAGDGSFIGNLLSGDGARVDLSPLAGKVVRLELLGKECAKGGFLRDARIVLPGGDAAAPPEGKPPRYVIFWVMDSTRADKIPTFTPGARAETPNFDRLAKDGAIFRQHYVGGNESQVSHTSMFTSLYPAVHTVRTAGNDIHYTIPKKYKTLGQLMHDNGYYTIGVTGNGFVGNWGGYSRGFEEFRNMMQEKGVVNGQLFGAEIVDEVIRRLTNHVKEDKPLFVFMGTVDSHSPWIRRDPWLDRLDPGPYDGPFTERGTSGPLGLMKGKMGCHKIPPDRDIQRLRAIYESTISYQDALIGDLRKALDKLGIADETMIVITADHGDELFEERRCGHGASLRDSLARVPLVVHYPGRVAGRVVDEGTEGVDILPTILDTIGAPLPEYFQGRSLRKLAAGEGAGWTEPSFASQYEYAFAVRLGRWKARIKKGRPIISDMVSDPDEHTDLVDSRPIERRYLTDHLGLYLEYREEWQKATWGVVSNMTEAAVEGMRKS